MIKTVDLLTKKTDDFLKEDLTLCTLTESSSLYLHGFDEDSFPDTIVCSYCGKILEAHYDDECNFIQYCDCEDYKAEKELQNKYKQLVESMNSDLQKLNEKQKQCASIIIKLNKIEYIKKREDVLQSEIGIIKDFNIDSTN